MPTNVGLASACHHCLPSEAAALASVFLQQLSCNHQPLYLTCSLVDLCDSCVSVVALGWHLRHVAHSAQDLDSLTRKATKPYLPGEGGGGGGFWKVFRSYFFLLSCPRKQRQRQRERGLATSWGELAPKVNSCLGLWQCPLTNLEKMLLVASSLTVWDCIGFLPI